jgi:hypothetical protein
MQICQSVFVIEIENIHKNNKMKFSCVEEFLESFAYFFLKKKRKF